MKRQKDDEGGIDLKVTSLLGGPSQLDRNHIKTLPSDILKFILHILVGTRKNGWNSVSLISLSSTCKPFRAFSLPVLFQYVQFWNWSQFLKFKESFPILDHLETLFNIKEPLSRFIVKDEKEIRNFLKRCSKLKELILPNHFDKKLKVEMCNEIFNTVTFPNIVKLVLCFDSKTEEVNRIVELLPRNVVQLTVMNIGCEGLWCIVRNVDWLEGFCFCVEEEVDVRECRKALQELGKRSAKLKRVVYEGWYRVMGLKDWMLSVCIEEMGLLDFRRDKKITLSPQYLGYLPGMQVTELLKRHRCDIKWDVSMVDIGFMVFQKAAFESLNITALSLNEEERVNEKVLEALEGNKNLKIRTLVVPTVEYDEPEDIQLTLQIFSKLCYLQKLNICAKLLRLINPILTKLPLRKLTLQFNKCGSVSDYTHIKVKLEELYFENLYFSNMVELDLFFGWLNYCVEPDKVYFQGVFGNAFPVIIRSNPSKFFKTRFKIKVGWKKGYLTTQF